MGGFFRLVCDFGLLFAGMPQCVWFWGRWLTVGFGWVVFEFGVLYACRRGVGCFPVLLVVRLCRVFGGFV